MKPSTEYLRIKAACKLNKPFKCHLTRSLAIELLLRSGDCRPVKNSSAMGFAFEFLSGTFKKEKGDPIGINYDTDNLFSGVQRLAGFILSGKKIEIMWFRFVDNHANVPFVKLPRK